MWPGQGESYAYLTTFPFGNSTSSVSSPRGWVSMLGDSCVMGRGLSPMPCLRAFYPWFVVSVHFFFRFWAEGIRWLSLCVSFESLFSPVGMTSGLRRSMIFDIILFMLSCRFVCIFFIFGACCTYNIIYITEVVCVYGVIYYFDEFSFWGGVSGFWSASLGGSCRILLLRL